MEALAKRADHADLECARFFVEASLCAAPLASSHCARARDTASQGAPLIGRLPPSGNGVPHEFEVPEEIDDLVRGASCCRANAPARPLCAGARKNNERLLVSLRDDEFEETLFKQAQDEAALGRLSPPVAVDGTIDLATIVVAQRFGVAQGLKADGTPKVRASSRASAARPRSPWARRYALLTITQRPV